MIGMGEQVGVADQGRKLQAGVAKNGAGQRQLSPEKCRSEGHRFTSLYSSATMKFYLPLLLLCLLVPSLLAYRIRVWNKADCDGNPDSSVSFDSSSEGKCRLRVTSNRIGNITETDYVRVLGECKKSVGMRYAVSPNSDCTDLGSETVDNSPISGCWRVSSDQSLKIDCKSAASTIAPSIALFGLVFIAVFQLSMVTFC